jgi:hypothetical protein
MHRDQAKQAGKTSVQVVVNTVYGMLQHMLIDQQSRRVYESAYSYMLHYDTC